MIGWALWRFSVLRSRKHVRYVRERICGTKHHRRYERLSSDASRCGTVPKDVLGGFPSTFPCIDRILGHSCASSRIGKPNVLRVYGHWNEKNRYIRKSIEFIQVIVDVLKRCCTFEKSFRCQQTANTLLKFSTAIELKLVYTRNALSDTSTENNPQ